MKGFASRKVVGFTIFVWCLVWATCDSFTFRTPVRLTTPAYSHLKLRMQFGKQLLSSRVTAYMVQRPKDASIDTQVDASSVNRDIPEKIRVDAYMEIKRLLMLEEKISDSLIKATGRPTLEDVVSDIAIVAKQIQERELKKQALLAARTPEEIQFEAMAIAYLSQDSFDMNISPEEWREYEERELFAILHKLPPKMEANRQKLTAALEKYRRHPTDVGSPEIQIARWTERIKYLTEHMLTNRKDYSSQRGLTQMVNDRRKMLNFLYQQSPDRAFQIATELGIRFKPPGQFWDKTTKYEVFKNTKSKVAKQLKEEREARKAAGLGPRRPATKTNQLRLDIEGLPHYTKLH